MFVVTENSIVANRVIRWGGKSAPSVGAGETLHEIPETPASRAWLEREDFNGLRWTKLVGTACEDMSAGEKALMDAAQQDQYDAQSVGAIDLRVVTLARLPVPPPRAGMFGAVSNGPGGQPALVASTATKWMVFSPTSEWPP